MSWRSRPPELSHSLNPAFCGMVIGECVAEYASTSGRAMPYPLPYLALPIVLHKRTRSSMPSTSRQRMHPWLARNQEAMVGFDGRARATVPFAREALIFLIQHGRIIVTPAGELEAGAAKPTGAHGSESPEVLDCAKKSKIVGKWFAPYKDPAEIFRMWGVKP